MIPNDAIDITQERDVSEAVELHDAETQPIEGPDDESVNMSDCIRFVSMDTNEYLMDKSIINWDATSENERNIRENMFLVRKILNELIFQKNSGDRSAIDQAFDVVEPFLAEFGFHPLENYKKMYPGCDDYDISLMFCIDAIEIMNVILREIAAYSGAKNAIKSIMETMSSIGGSIDE